MRKTVKFILCILVVGISACSLFATPAQSYSAESAVVQAQREIERLQRIIAGKDKELSETKADLQGQRNANATLQKQIEELKQEIGELKNRLARLDADLKTKNSEAERLREQIKRLEHQLSTGNNAYKCDIDELNKKVEDYKQKCKYYKKAYIAVSIVLYSIVAIILLASLYFALRGAKSKLAKKEKKSCSSSTPVEHSPAKTKEATTKEDELRCPMCGWKYNPGDKVCKNCRTQF